MTQLDLASFSSLKIHRLLIKVLRTGMLLGYMPRRFNVAAHLGSFSSLKIVLSLNQSASDWNVPWMHA